MTSQVTQATNPSLSETREAQAMPRVQGVTVMSPLSMSLQDSDAQWGPTPLVTVGVPH